MKLTAGRFQLMGRGSRGEVADIAEPGKADTSLSSLLKIRKQRLDRLEHERLEALTGWRRARADLRDRHRLWRTARQDTIEFWQETRRNFFSMTTTSGEFRRQKARYLRMQEQAAQLLLECRQTVQHCRDKREIFFGARRRVKEATMQCEKLGILREQLALLIPKLED